MKKFLIILFFGFLVWILFFGITLLAEPLHENDPVLFEYVKFLSLLFFTVFFLVVYFRKLFSGFAGEGMLVGIIWFGLCLLLSWLFNDAREGFGQYFLSQGLLFISIPLVSSGFDLIVKRKIW